VSATPPRIAVGGVALCLALAAGARGAIDLPYDEWRRGLADPSPAKRRAIVMQILDAFDDAAEDPPTSPRAAAPDLARVLPIIEIAVGDPDHEVRFCAMDVFPRVRSIECVPLLLRCLRSAHADMRYFAAIRLEEVGHRKDILPVAIAALVCARATEADLNARLAIEASLFKVDLPPNVAVFFEALRTTGANDAYAATQLAALGRKDAIALMVARLQTAVPNEDDYLGEALVELTGEHFGKDYARWRAWLDENRAKLPPQAK
jgi:hypothetical protein